MDGSKFYDGANDMLSLLENCDHPFWTASSSSSLQETMLMNFDGQEPQLGVHSNPKRNRIDRSLLLAATTEMEDLIGEEDLDVGNTSNQADKKRRLTKAQVKSLEKSFEEENKLEPERKMELAEKLGLEPKQISIWFQNRRARYKSKQIEKEYDTLKANYDQLQEDYAILSREKKNSDEVAQLWKSKYFELEKNTTNPNLDALLQSDEGIVSVETQGKFIEIEPGRVVKPMIKQAEDVSSAKSDIYDSESPHCMVGNQYSSALPVEASSALMRDMDPQSDFSQDDNEQIMINNNLLMPQTPPTFNNFIKVQENNVIYDDPDANSCNLLYDPIANSCNISLVDEQPVMWPWLH